MTVKRYECGMTNAPAGYQAATMHHCDDGGYVSYEDYAALADQVRLLTEQRDALVVDNVVLKEALTAVIDRSSEPEYHYAGMGCGVEDNGLQADGYSACEYGWREAMQRVYSEVIPDAFPETPATDAAIAALRAEAFNDLCKAFVLHKQSACLDDTDKVSVREATDALLHCAEQLARQLRDGDNN